MTMAIRHYGSNMFLCHFRRLIHLAMIFRRRFLKHLFVDCQMMERLVDFYQNRPYPRCTLHGYIVQMLWDIYHHDQGDEDEEDDEEEDDTNYSDEDDPQQRPSVIIKPDLDVILDETGDVDGDNEMDDDDEKGDEFEEDVVLRPNFSSEPEDQWDIVSFFEESQVWQQFSGIVCKEMDAQNATDTQVPNMNVATNQQELDKLLANLLGPNNEDADSDDSDSDSEDE